jgi:hypothetical protein
MLKDHLDVIEWTYWRGNQYKDGPLGMLLHDIKKKYPVRNAWVLYYTVHNASSYNHYIFFWIDSLWMSSLHFWNLKLCRREGNYKHIKDLYAISYSLH